MTKDRERRFKIDVFTPESLPMERLAEYMLLFARLLGEKERVHFVNVERGSAVLRARVEAAADVKVANRLSDAARGQGDPVALRAIQQLDDMLANDNAVGQILDDAGAEVIAFQGRTRPKPLEFGPFREDGVLEGVIIKVGGVGERAPVWLHDNSQVHKHCRARRSLARDLGKHIYSSVVRVTGSGDWMRLSTGGWLMRSFDIKDFDVLDDAPLVDVIKRLHGVSGAKWGDDPLAELADMRGEVEPRT
jgi:hypothetical protein